MSFKEEAIYQLRARANLTNGLGRTYIERAIQIVSAIPENVVVEEKKEETQLWTPVNKKPKRKGMYLTYIICPEGNWIEISKYIGKGQWENLYNGEDATDYVEAWMPLPVAPDMPELRKKLVE